MIYATTCSQPYARNHVAALYHIHGTNTRGSARNCSSASDRRTQTYAMLFFHHKSSSNAPGNESLVYRSSLNFRKTAQRSGEKVDEVATLSAQSTPNSQLEPPSNIGKRCRDAIGECSEVLGHQILVCTGPISSGSGRLSATIGIEIILGGKFLEEYLTVLPQSVYVPNLTKDIYPYLHAVV